MVEQIEIDPNPEDPAVPAGLVAMSRVDAPRACDPDDRRMAAIIGHLVALGADDDLVGELTDAIDAHCASCSVDRSPHPCHTLTRIEELLECLEHEVTSAAKGSPLRAAAIRRALVSLVQLRDLF
jgi:hypothetical protein